MREQSALTLESEAVQALAAGDVAIAFRLADRRCRIAPQPRPHCYVLRAEALHRLGQHAWALDDIARALAMAPDDIAANRRRLLWGAGEERLAAALALARHDHDEAVRRQALDHLRAAGRPTLASLSVSDQRIEGWAVADDDGPVEVTASDEAGTTTWEIALTQGDPLAGTAFAARFDLPRPEACGTQTIAVTRQSRSLALVRMSSALGSRRDPSRLSPSPRSRGDGPHEADEGVFEVPLVRPSATFSPPGRRSIPSTGLAAAGPVPATGVTIIVPVYGDYEATRACLDSLLAALAGAPADRLILVDDASPDPRITALLGDLAAREGVTVLANARNRGFVGSINRALEEAPCGDVLLLNADTLVPASFVSGLAAAARTDPAIGTLTPLSNNGEFTSFPVPNIANPLPDLTEVIALDALAAACNPGLVVDVPSGIGFCLYITRACLAAVGPLSEDYQRGYLEDADFCLRARELGFRNVCAASVFVGHAGGRSFAAEKRALVVRNLSILERRFPSHRAECAAFMAADPLRTARAAIERALPPPTTRPHLLITPAGPIRAIAAERARRLAAAGSAAVLVTIGGGAPATSVALVEASGLSPQSITLDLATTAGEGAFHSTCAALAPARLEVFDCAACPDGLLRAILCAGPPLDLWATTPALAGLLDGPAGGGPPPRWPAHPPLPGRTVPSADRAGLLRRLVDQADRILVPERAAAAALIGRGPERVLVMPDEAPVRLMPQPRSVHLAIVPVCRSAREQALVAGLAHGLAARRPDLPMTVVGDTADGPALMRTADIFVTGPVEDDDLESVLEAYGVGQVLLALDRPLFGHPTTRRVGCGGRPLAYVDWSQGTVRPRADDLAIDPRWPLARAVEAIAAWLPATAAESRPPVAA